MERSRPCTRSGFAVDRTKSEGFHGRRLGDTKRGEGLTLPKFVAKAPPQPLSIFILITSVIGRYSVFKHRQAVGSNAYEMLFFVLFYLLHVCARMSIFVCTTTWGSLFFVPYFFVLQQNDWKLLLP